MDHVDATPENWDEHVNYHRVNGFNPYSDLAVIVRRMNALCIANTPPDRTEFARLTNALIDVQQAFEVKTKTRKRYRL